MPKEIQLPDGTIAEFPDDMSDDAITAVLQKQFAPPGAGGIVQQGQHIVEQLNQDPLKLIPGYEGSNTQSATDLAARVGSSIVSAIPDLAVMGGQALRHAVTGGGGWLPEKFPHDYVNEAAGITLRPDASPAMKAADTIAPWLIPSRGAANVISEAPTLAGRVAGLARNAAGGVVDYGASQAASYGAGKAAEAAGYDPEVASIIAGVLGPAARNYGVSVPAAAAFRSRYAAPNAREIGEAADRLDMTPTAGMLMNERGKEFEHRVGSLPVLGSGVNQAHANVLADTENALANLTGMTERPQQSDVAHSIIDRAREIELQRRAAESAEQGAIESTIGSRTPTDVSPILDIIEQRAGREPGTGDPGVGEPFKARARAMEPNLRNDIEAMNPGNREANANSLQAIEDAMNRNEEMRQDYLRRAQAAQGPVTLNPQQAADYVESLAGTLNPRELFQLQTRLQSSKFGGKGQLTVGPGDPGYASVAPPMPPAPNYLPVPQEVPLASTAGYGAIKDERSLLREKMEGLPRLTDEHMQPYYDAHTEAMRNAAEATPGVGAARFEQANRRYAQLQEDIPWLESKAGELNPATGQFVNPSEQAIFMQTKRAVGPNERHLQEISENLGPDTAQQAVRSIIRGFGTAEGPGAVDMTVRPDRLAKHLGDRVNATAQDMLGAEGAQAVQDLQTVGRAYSQPRQQRRLGREVTTGGFLADMASRALASRPGTAVRTVAALPFAAAAGHALESPGLRRVLTGEYSPLIDQLIMRSGIAAGQKL